MPYALVGTAAAASQGAASAAVTAAWGTSQNRTANNLLTCEVAGAGVATFPTTPSGWQIARQVSGTSCSATIYYKIAAGSDAAPTIAAVTSAIWSVQLAEYSGGPSTLPIDQTASASGVTTPSTATCGAPDRGSGDLTIGCFSEYRSMAATTTNTIAFNNGATSTSVNNTSTSTQSHYNFCRGITTGNSAADTFSVSGFSTSQLTGTANAFASFALTPLPNISTLTDTFQGTSVNSALWNTNYVTGGSVTEGGGSLNLVTGTAAGSSSLQGIPYYSLANSAVYVKVVAAGTQTSYWSFCPLVLQPSTGSSLFWSIANGTISAQSGGPPTGTTLWSATYSATTHVWLRIREASGTTYFDYSPDGYNWTTAYSAADPVAMVPFQCWSMGFTTSTQSTTTTMSIAWLNVQANQGVGSFGFTGTAAATMVGPSFTTLVDPFQGSSINATLWNVSSTTNITEGGGTLRIQPPANVTRVDYLYSIGYYNLTGVAVSVIGSNAPTTSGYMYYPINLSDSSGNNQLYWSITGGQISALHMIGSTPTTLKTIAYNSTNHLWLRIRESSGTTYWDTSPDGAHWTNFFSEANPISVTALSFWFQAGVTTAMATPNSMSISCLNTVAFSNLSDNFTGGSVDGTKWTVSNSSMVTEGGGGVNIATSTTAQVNTLTSINKFCLAFSGVSVKVVSAGDQTIASHTMYPIYLEDTTAGANAYYCSISGNTLGFYHRISGTSTLIWSAAYSPTNHAWVQISEGGGSTRLNTSANGTSWALQSYEADAIDITNLLCSFQAGTTATETSTTTDTISSLNSSGPGGSVVIGFTATATATLALPSTGTATGTFTATATGAFSNPNQSIISRAAIDGGSPNTSASFTPPAGSVLLVGIWVFANAAGTTSIADTFGDSGGTTWAPFTGSSFTTAATYGNMSGGWWRTIGHGATAGTVSITTSGWTGGESILIVDQFTLTTGYAAVVQSNVADASYAATGSVSLATTPAPLDTVWSSGSSGHTGQALVVTTARFTGLDLVNTGTSLSEATSYVNAAAPITVAWSGLNTGQNAKLVAAELGPMPVTGAMAGTFAATATGTWRMPGTGTATGTFTATATATYYLIATGSATGSFVTSATGVVRVAGTGTITASFAATAVGAVGVQVPGTGTGTGSFSGLATGTSVLPGTIPGLNMPYGQGPWAGVRYSGTLSAATGASAASFWTFTATATGVVHVAATGAMAGSFLATATGSAYLPATGTASAVFAANATGLVSLTGTGSAPWAFNATATGSAYLPSSGSVTGSFNGTATGVVLLSGAAGTASGSFTATATGSAYLPATGTVLTNFNATANGLVTVAGSGSQAWAFNATATGSAYLPATGSITAVFNATATGTAQALASGSFTGTFNGTAAGSYYMPASASGTGAFNATAAGVVVMPTTGTGAFTFLATSTASAYLPGTGAVTGNFNGVANALVAIAASGTANFGFAAMALSGGAASVAITFVASATASVAVPATGSMTAAFLAQATGSVIMPASATGVFGFTAAATPTGKGAFNAAFNATGAGAIVMPSTGTASGTFNAIASAGLGATGAVSGVFNATAVGQAVMPASASATGSFLATATSGVVVSGSGTASFGFNGTAATTGQGVVTIGFNGVAVGLVFMPATGTAHWGFQGTAGSIMAATGSGTGTFNATAQGTWALVGTGSVSGSFNGQATGVLITTLAVTVSAAVALGTTSLAYVVVAGTEQAQSAMGLCTPPGASLSTGTVIPTVTAATGLVLALGGLSGARPGLNQTGAIAQGLGLSITLSHITNPVVTNVVAQGLVLDTVPVRAVMGQYPVSAAFGLAFANIGLAEAVSITPPPVYPTADELIGMWEFHDSIAGINVEVPSAGYQGYNDTGQPVGTKVESGAEIDFDDSLP